MVRPAHRLPDRTSHGACTVEAARRVLRQRRQRDLRQGRMNTRKDALRCGWWIIQVLEHYGEWLARVERERARQ